MFKALAAISPTNAAAYQYGGGSGSLSNLSNQLFGNPNAPGQAAELQAQAIREGIAAQQKQFEAGQKALQPFQAAQLQALQQQRALLGLGSPAEQQAAMAAMQETPGQQFMRQRQERALLRNAAATGGLGGGNVRTALQQQAAGFASQDLNQRLAQLQALGGGAAQQMAQLGMGYGGQQAAALQAIGQAQASGILGREQMRAQRTGQLAQLGGMAMAYSDARLKTNVHDLTNKKACFDAVIGLPLRVWNYLPHVGGPNSTHFGPMAHEMPDLVKVHDIDGYKAIDLHDELMLIAGAIQYINEMQAANDGQGVIHAVG